MKDLITPEERLKPAQGWRVELADVIAILISIFALGVALGVALRI